MPRTFLQMYYVARPIDCGAGLLRCLSALEEAAFSAPRNGLCELREPSAASGGRSEAEAQCARELTEAAFAATRSDLCELWKRQERDPGPKAPGPALFVWLAGGMAPGAVPPAAKRRRPPPPCSRALLWPGMEQAAGPPGALSMPAAPGEEAPAVLTALRKAGYTLKFTLVSP